MLTKDLFIVRFRILPTDLVLIDFFAIESYHDAFLGYPIAYHRSQAYSWKYQQL